MEGETILSSMMTHTFEDNKEIVNGPLSERGSALNPPAGLYTSPPPKKEKFKTEQEKVDCYNKLKRSGSRTLRLRGLPFSAKKKDIEDFFYPLQLCTDNDAIIFGLDKRNRPSGEAFVTFVSNEEALKGLNYDHKYMGERYIEIFGTIDKEKKNKNNAYNENSNRSLYLNGTTQTMNPPLGRSYYPPPTRNYMSRYPPSNGYINHPSAPYPMNHSLPYHYLHPNGTMM